MSTPTHTQETGKWSERFASFGEPEIVFAPTPGLTPLGISVTLVFGMGAFGCAAFVDEIAKVRIGFAVIGCLAFGAAYWIWRLRNWRVLICPNGLIQIGAWRIQAVRWSEMTHIVAVCLEGTEDHEEVEVVTSTRRMAIGTSNLREWRKMLATVVQSARSHDVCVVKIFTRINEK